MANQTFISFLNKVKNYSRLDFIIIITIIILYAVLHYLALAVTPFQLFGMYSEPQEKIQQASSYKVMLNNKFVNLGQLGGRKQSLFNYQLSTFENFQEGHGEQNNKVYDYMVDHLPPLHLDARDSLYINPDYQQHMRWWIQDFFDCPNCEVALFKYNYRFDANYYPVIIDSIQVL